MEDRASTQKTGEGFVPEEGSPAAGLGKKRTPVGQTNGYRGFHASPVS